METKLKITNNNTLKDIFDGLERGNIKIPRFQRDYVWERPKIVQLLNSLYQQYPIGSLFFWEANANQYANFLREIEELGLPKQPESNTYNFILDGQQRVTSLFVALKNKTLRGTDYGSICFNLEKQVFQIPKLKTEQHNIPAWKLFDNLELTNVVTHYSDQNNPQYNPAYVRRWMECYQILTSYPISIIKSLNMDLGQVVDIFERINQGGKRLTLFDLVHAGAWSETFDLREKINSFHKELAMQSYGQLDNETFTQALAFNAFEDCLHKSQLNLTAEKCAHFWPRTITCLKLTLDFLKHFGVQKSSYLPYGSLVAILQHYLFYSEQNAFPVSIRSLLADYFWTATFSQRFSSSSLTRMNQDAEWIRQLVGGNLTSLRFQEVLEAADLVKIRMQTASVVKNGVLCLMALQIPRDFDNGDQVNLANTQIARSNAKQNHHIFPYSLRQAFGTDDKQINTLMNFALISARLNGEISNKKPSGYITNYKQENATIEEHLATHFVNDVGIMAMEADDYTTFIQARAEIVIQAIRQKTRPVLGATESIEN